MSDADQHEANEQAEGSAPAHGPDGLPISDFKVVPSTTKFDQSDIYSFRAAFVAPEPAPQPARKPARPKSALGVNLLVAVAALSGLALVVFLGLKFFQPKPPIPYMDLGTQMFHPAGLGGRLIARWDGSPAYQLSIDPTDQDLVAGFEAVATDPPRPLSLTLRLRDSSGRVVCQKNVLFPDFGSGADRAQVLAPQKTGSGDTVQNVAGEDGRIAEIDISGGLPCALKAYLRFAAWDFSSNFPTIADQDDWLKHENALSPGVKHYSVGPRIATQVAHLSAPLEGDDTIVGDNPSRGTVDTSGGRIFLIGVGGLRNRSAEWQVFPAPIHFRCDKNGLCILTRVNSRSSLQARLLK